MLLMALRVVRDIRIETGRILTPHGEEINGFKVYLSKATDPATITRSYADIEHILKANEASYRTSEEHTPEGTFKSYIVQT